MRCAIYLRVSTLDQSVAMQRKDLESYCQAKGLAAIEYVDEGISGSKKSRPGLNRLMQDVRRGKYEMVLVWRFDRFARSTSQLVEALDEFKQLGVRFVSYQEGIDTNTPMGQAMFTVIAAMAQFERDIIRERVKAGLAAAKARGVRLGQKRRTSIEEVRALRAGGHSLQKIATKLGASIGSVRSALASKPANPVSPLQCAGVLD